MSIGISTSCFYPLETELSLLRVAALRADCCEVFFNSWSEIEEPFAARLKRAAREGGVRVSAVHPFLSFGETYLLFSEYRRRFDDSMELFKKFFSAAAMLEAGFVVLHGGRNPGAVDGREQFERYALLAEEALRQGVVLAQENVVHYRSQSPDFLERMKEHIGPLFRFVLDIKQARRAGYSPFDFSVPLADSLVHVHVSDFNAISDCLPPGEGGFDFAAFFAELSACGYAGDHIIEVYRGDFADDAQLRASADFLEKLL